MPSEKSETLMETLFIKMVKDDIVLEYHHIFGAGRQGVVDTAQVRLINSLLGIGGVLFRNHVAHPVVDPQTDKFTMGPFSAILPPFQRDTVYAMEKGPIL